MMQHQPVDSYDPIDVPLFLILIHLPVTVENESLGDLLLLAAGEHETNPIAPP
jgi:hypothetical protein